MGTGILFRRVDLPRKPEVPATSKYLHSVPRRSSLRNGSAEVDTVEHLLASLVVSEEIGHRHLEAGTHLALGSLRAATADAEGGHESLVARRIEPPPHRAGRARGEWPVSPPI